MENKHISIYIYLFIIFTNDMIHSVNDVFCNLFADDVILYANANEICKVNEKLQQNVDSFSECYRKID